MTWNHSRLWVLITTLPQDIKKKKEKGSNIFLSIKKTLICTFGGGGWGTPGGAQTILIEKGLKPTQCNWNKKSSPFLIKEQFEN